MVREQRERFKRTLLKERTRLSGFTPDTREALAAPTTIAIEDQASVLHDQEVALRSHEIDRYKHRLIEQAIRRLDRGEFGICQECLQPIPQRRLEAIPWAAYCVRCQEQLDEVEEEPA